MHKRKATHPHAVCPHLTVSDLFLFRDLFQGLRSGKALTVVAGELKIGPRKRLLLRAVEEALALDGEDRGFVRRHARGHIEEDQPGDEVHTRLSVGRGLVGHP